MARRFSKTSAPTRSISPLRWAGIGCGITVVLGLIAIVVAYVLATSQPPPPREAAHSPAVSAAADTGAQPSPSSPGTASSPTPAPSLEAQLREAHEAGRSDRASPVRLTIRQAELNSYLARETAREGDVQNVQAYFGEGTVVTTGRVKWQGRAAYLTVRAHPLISGGDVDLVVDDTAIGRLPAPGAVRQQAQDRLNKALDELLARGRFHAESVSVRPGVMIIEGRAGGRL